MVRPAILNPLFADISSLPGIGQKYAHLLAKLLSGHQVIDLLYHLPFSMIDRRHMPPIHAMKAGTIITTVVKVEKYLSAPGKKGKRLPVKVQCQNETGVLTLIFFHIYPQFLIKKLPIGQMVAISGKVETYHGEVQLIHPDYIVPAHQLATIKKVEAIYPLTTGVTIRGFHKAINIVKRNIPILPEWIEQKQKTQQQWKDWRECLMSLHNLHTQEQLHPDDSCRKRLAYDELLASQLALRLSRLHDQKKYGYAINSKGTLVQRVMADLPFMLTNGQKQVIETIYHQQKAPERMVHLLQGDVGSGKTVVSLCAMLHVVEAGMQAAMMVPIEILAQQHVQWMQKICSLLPIKIALLTGSSKASEKRKILEELAKGDIHIVIGTHALFQEKVHFQKLGLVVIDEQHRFGVKQRMALTAKGENPDMLLMTATPIPRTLTLAVYGDMECSRLQEKPAGRQLIQTSTISVSRDSEVIAGLQKVIQNGHKAYWICPLIEESESIDLAAAEQRFAKLQHVFQKKIGLLHGKMKKEEREKVILDFRDGVIQLLVATTVVEVGVDVADATVMVIEHAERFGLSQLHQLRGRVGRSHLSSFCILLYEKLTPVAKKRLQIMRQHTDGFFIAEQDLWLRGGGEVLGTKQSGLPSFSFAVFPDHEALLAEAHQDAINIIASDPKLQSSRGQALRTLLYLFKHDVQVTYLTAG